MASVIPDLDPWTVGPPDSSVHGIVPARKATEWVTIPFSRRLSPSRIEPVILMSPAFTGGFFTHFSTSWEVQAVIFSQISYLHFTYLSHSLLLGGIGRDPR